MAHRISSIRLGNHCGIIQMRTCSTMMSRCFLHRGTMPSSWMTSRTGRQIGWNKSNRRLSSERIPKVAEKVVGHATKQTWLQKFLSLKEMPEKYTYQWYREMVLLCTVFAITGSSTMFLVSRSDQYCVCTNQHAGRSNTAPTRIPPP